MPELPEVETVKAGLLPVMEGYVFEKVQLNRPDLRFPFPVDFVARIQGQTCIRLWRRAKFLVVELGSGDRLLMHLGMSGRFTINTLRLDTNYVHQQVTDPKHDHVIFDMSSGYQITFNDPRRFGFMELLGPDDVSRMDDLGPEPLSNHFNAPYLRKMLRGRKSKIKSALLDQRIVAGLGNIYVCEALYRSGISPRRGSARLKVAETEALTGHIKDVLTDAIQAGGSTLRDFAGASGELGYFQHQFDVYGREADPCRICGQEIARIVQSGRSSFYCRACQK